MKTALIVNRQKAESKIYLETALQCLHERGVETSLLMHEGYCFSELAGADFIITLGGDGTLLRAAAVLHGAGIPILGINLGHLGYLTEVADRNQIPEVIGLMLSGRYTRDVRSMIRAELYRDGVMIREGIALNEVLISRLRGVSILRFGIYCDGLELSHYASDGIIVATPTGSTAYNLSAGGPIVSPHAPVHILTPVSSHSLTTRPVILEDTGEIEIHAESDNQILSFDGGNLAELVKGDIVRIRKAEETTTLVQIHTDSFLKTLREKMWDL